MQVDEINGIQWTFAGDLRRGLDSGGVSFVRDPDFNVLCQLFFFKDRHFEYAFQ